MWVRGHSGSFRLVPCEGLGAVSYFPSIVTMALSCILNKARNWSKIVIFSYPLHSTPLLGGPRRNIAIPFRTEKLEW